MGYLESGQAEADWGFVRVRAKGKLLSDGYSSFRHDKYVSHDV